MTNKHKHISEEAIYQLYLAGDRAAIEQALSEDISDIKAYEQKKKAFLARIKFLAKAEANKQRHDKLIQMANAIRAGIDQYKENPIELLRKLIPQKGSSLSFFSRLEGLSKDQLLDLVKDQRFLELLEQLDKDENNI